MSDVQFHYGGRRSGRTTLMIDWLLAKDAEKERVIVCHSGNEAERIFRLVKDLGIERNQIITLSQKDSLRGRDVEIGIDNLEFLFSQVFGQPVTYVTATIAQDFGTHKDSGFVLIKDTHYGS